MNGHQLHLTLSTAEANNFFISAEWDGRNLDWSGLRSRPKALRAVCILLLLAKHRQQVANPNKIKFVSLERRKEEQNPNTWIYTLCGAAQDNAFKNSLWECFPIEHKIFIAERGGRHKDKSYGETHVTYLDHFLPVGNIRFFTQTPAGKKTEISGEELAAYAEKLEAYETGKGNSWLPLVRENLNQTGKLAQNKSAVKSAANGNHPARHRFPDNVWLTEWRDCAKGLGEAGEKIKHRLDNSKPGDNWYFISVTPDGFEHWKPHVSEAVGRHGVNLKWIHHSKTAGEQCEKMQAQWMMNYTYPEKRRVAEVLERLAHEENTLKTIVRNARHLSEREGTACGSFEIYESKIVHFFMGFMIVPRQSGAAQKPAVNGWVERQAPAGTLCVIQPYAMYPISLGSRHTLFLEGESRLLDVYYNSISSFFNDGRRRGYLKPLDPLTLLPRQKRKNG